MVQLSRQLFQGAADFILGCPYVAPCLLALSLLGASHGLFRYHFVEHDDFVRHQNGDEASGVGMATTTPVLCQLFDIGAVGGAPEGVAVLAILLLVPQDRDGVVAGQRGPDVRLERRRVHDLDVYGIGHYRDLAGSGVFDGLCPKMSSCPEILSPASK